MVARLSMAALCVLLLLCSSKAWHGNGHYLVAYIAQEYLVQTNPDALKWANDLLAPYTLLCGENLYPFVEAATWSDKVKDQGWHIVDSHHFISNAWFDQGAKPYVFENNTSANIVFAINENIATLKSVKEDPYGSSKSLLGKSLCLRTLIHYHGDIHQPLHAEERVTPKLPKGDMGGNLFPIKHYNDPHMDNLHFIWDEMFENISEDIRSNLPPEKYQFIKRRGDELIAEIPLETISEQIAQNNTALSWGLESFEIAKTFSYSGLQENAGLTQQYIDEGRRICRKRVVLGGYRLGMTLDAIYKSIQSRKSLKSAQLEDSRSSGARKSLQSVGV